MFASMNINQKLWRIMFGATSYLKKRCKAVNRIGELPTVPAKVLGNYSVPAWSKAKNNNKKICTAWIREKKTKSSSRVRVEFGLAKPNSTLTGLNILEEKYV